MKLFKTRFNYLILVGRFILMLFFGTLSVFLMYLIIEKLKLLKPEENSNFFRFSSDKYYLELSEVSNKYLIYADEIWDNKKTGEIFITEIQLTNNQITEINTLIDSLKINDIPSDNQIREWRISLKSYCLENGLGRAHHNLRCDF